MTGIVWADAAIVDLRDLLGYLREQHSPGIDRAELDRLILGARWLVQHPRAGAPIRGFRLRKWKPRGSRNLLIYQPAAAGIVVLRIRHEMEDWRADPLGDGPP